MGWLSDKLFGKRASIDHKRIDNYMQPFNDMVDRYEEMCNERLDTFSQWSQQNRNMMVSNALTMNQGNLNQLGGVMASGAMSPAQILQNMRQSQNTALSGVESNFQNFMGQQRSEAMSLLDRAMKGRLYEGERQSNAHIQDVNAHNARRDQRFSNMMDIAGLGLKVGAQFWPQGGE